MNTFTCHQDDERRQAHRSEKKRRLAEIEVKRLRLQELRNIQRTLEADSETAADCHSTDAGKLQAELDKLDEQHVNSLMAGGTSPPKSIERRSQIMRELNELNTALEMRCEANRRAALPVKKQIQDLQIEIGKCGAIENDLCRLASADVRRGRAFIDLQLMFSEHLTHEIQRRLNVARHNIHVTTELNKEPEKSTVYVEQASDFEWMLREVGRNRMALMEQDRALHQQALSE